MATATKVSASYTLDREAKDYIRETRGTLSESQRANDLLNAAIEAEQLLALERQAERFYANPRNADRENTRAFQKAAIKVQARG